MYSTKDIERNRFAVGWRWRLLLRVRALLVAKVSSSSPAFRGQIACVLLSRLSVQANRKAALKRVKPAGASQAPSGLVTTSESTQAYRSAFTGESHVGQIHLENSERKLRVSRFRSPLPEALGPFELSLIGRSTEGFPFV